MANEIDVWRGNRLSPFAGLNSLQRTMNRVFDDFWGPSFNRDLLSDFDVAPAFSLAPACEVDETDDYLIYCLDVPGVNKNDIKVEIANNILTVSGERKEEEGERDRRSYRRRYGRFERSIAIPGTVDSSKVEASYENGVLRIALPKTEEMKAHQIPISEGKTGIFQKIASGAKDATEKIVGKVRGQGEKSESETAAKH